MYFTSEVDFFVQELTEAELKFSKDAQNVVDGFFFKQGAFEIKANKLK